MLFSASERRFVFYVHVVFASFLAFADSALAQDAVVDGRRLTFEEHVVPILEARCVQCHGGDKSESGLDLRRRFTMLKGGDSGPAIVPHQPESSLLMEFIDSLNADKPFDQFVREQIAGDEIQPNDPQCQTAAIFHRLGAVRRNAGNPEIALSRNEVLTERTLKLIRELSESTLESGDDELQARLNSYDLAFRMQTQAPEVFDLGKETQETLDLYGVGRKPTDDYGRRCLLARRLVEKGVRFVCVVSGGGPGNMQWDAHDDIDENHLRKASETDQPVAGLLKDLKRRGLLEETLVLWGGEFGRSPEAQGSKGRDHHNLGFTMLMAGGGVKGGQIVGATDEIGLRAVESPHHFRDIHATILHQLGLDQHQLTWRHRGRDERLTFLEGRVIEAIV